MSFRISDYDFSLPEELIAQEPINPRDHSRLLVVERETGKLTEDRFYNLIRYLRVGDLLVVNDARVIPARIFGRKETGGKIEFLLLERLSEHQWKVLLRPARKIEINKRIVFDDSLSARIIERMPDGVFIAEFYYSGDFMEILKNIGRVPLPPYIKREATPEDEIRYQTVYAESPGAVAAPTAGLHFTEQLISELKGGGIEFAKLTLLVGWGTFRKIDVDDIREHRMHEEFFIFPGETASAIMRAKSEKRRVIAVGTTTVRVLETVGKNYPELRALSGYTDLFIYPPYEFKIVDGIITNFHLPRSSLIVMISAFATREIVMKAYAYAIEKKFRFYSYGDAMLIF